MRIGKTNYCVGCETHFHSPSSRVDSRPKHFCDICIQEPRPFKTACLKYKVNMETAKAFYQITHCQCCHKQLTESTGPGSTTHSTRQIDHDHQTGKVRGVICWTCNGGIGKLGDTVAGLQQAINYLQGNSI